MNFTSLLAAFAVALLVVAAAPAKAAVSSEHVQATLPNPQAVDALRAAMRKLVDDKKRAGISYAVIYKGQLVASDSYGYRNVEKKLPMQSDSIVRLFSMTRAISTVVFLTLVEDGTINLDDPVSKYIPAFGSTPVLRDPKSVETVAQVRPMTLRMLLNYDSGLGYPFDLPTPIAVKQTYLMGPDVPTALGIERLAKLPLIHQPGERWRYGFHSDVLGRVAEIATGKPLDALLRERLFDKIGMKDTGFYAPPEKVGRLARAYGPVGNNPLGDVNATWQPEYGTFDKPIAYLSAGGGLASTLDDYVRFLRLLRNGGELDGVRILTPETVRLMLTAQVPLAPGVGYHPNTGWGFGIGVRTTGTKRPGDLPGHEVFWGGLANTTFLMDTDNDLIAVGMTQYFGPDEAAFTEGFRDAVYRLLLP